MNLPARRPDERIPRPTSYRQVGLNPDTSWYEVEPTWPSERDHDAIFTFSLADAKEMATFPFRAVGRHRGVALLIFIATLGMSVLAAFVLPRHYVVDTKILAESNAVMPALNNPRRSVPSQSDAPTRLAGEAVMKQANLLEIMRQTNLMSTWESMRSPLGHVEDWVRSLLGKQLTPAQRTEAMVALLRRRMWVVPNDGTVTIGVDWSDPQTAYRLAQTAQQNFVDQRHESEVAMISESVGILEGHVADAQAAIQDAVAQINKMGGVARRSAPAPRPVVSVPRPTPQSAELTALQTSLRARQQTIADLESARAQRISALQASLAELRNNYGAAHPQVVSTLANIRALSADSPQLTALRSEEASLEAKIIALGGRPGETAAPPAADPIIAKAALANLARSSADSVEDPEVTYAKSRLKMATSDYEDLLGRLNAARIELQTARAAFKYQYTVVTPPVMPTRPAKPRIPLLIAGGLFLAIALAFFAGTALDLGSGRLIERWQVARTLHLPILAQAPPV